MWANGLYVSFSGLIGAGKTTLAAALAEELQLPLYCEKVSENKCLTEFYKNQKKNAFLLQISLLTQRLRQQYMINWNEKGAVQDRSIYEDLIFCKMLLNLGLLTDLEYNTYLELWNVVSSQLPRPDIIIHLDVTPAQSLERIRKRGREIESGITLSYLESLHLAYQDFLPEIGKKTVVIVIPWPDFIDREHIAAKVREVWESPNRLHYIVLE
jgi:deoxyadenosine kinase